MKRFLKMMISMLLVVVILIVVVAGRFYYSVYASEYNCSVTKDSVDVNATNRLRIGTYNVHSLNYGKEDQQGLNFMSLKEAKQYIEEGQFSEGSMLPKVEACMDFVRHRRTGQAIITSLDRSLDALLGKTGTVITRKVDQNGKK